MYNPGEFYLPIYERFMKKFRFLFGLLALCFSSVLFSGNVFAADNISVTYTSTPTDGSAIFPTCNDSSCLSQYHYLIVEISSPLTVNYRFHPFSQVGASSYFSISPYSSSAFYTLPDNMSYFNFAYTSEYSIYGGDGVTFILTENNPSPSGTLSVTQNGTYDVTNYASVDVFVEEDCDTPFIVKMFEGGFWSVATALVSLIVPTLALFLVFRIVHDLIFRERM